MTSINFQMTVDPKETLIFEGKPKTGIETTLTISNPTKTTKVYKVKCTDNDLFNIPHPIKILEPGESETLNLYYLPTYCGFPDPDKQHRFIVFHMDSPEGTINGRQAWARYKGPLHRISIPVKFKKEKKKEEKEKGEEKKEGKKEGKKKEEETREKKEEGTRKKKEEKVIAKEREAKEKKEEKNEEEEEHEDDEDEDDEDEDEA